jgi:regulator of sigma D
MINLTDKLLEVYITKHGRPRIKQPYNKVNLVNLNDKSILTFLRKNMDFLSNGIYKIIDEEADVEISQIRAQLLSDLIETLYSLTSE